MQRVEQINNRIIEHFTAPSVSSGSSNPSSSVSNTTRKMMEVCNGNNYLTGDTSQMCGCNTENTIVNNNVGDGTNLIDLCTDGSMPNNTIGANYCKPGHAKIVYELGDSSTRLSNPTGTISYRINALNEDKSKARKPAVIKRWCAAIPQK